MAYGWRPGPARSYRAARFRGSAPSGWTTDVSLVGALPGHAGVGVDRPARDLKRYGLMTISENRPDLRVPARQIPVPSHLSPEAQQALAAGSVEQRPFPALDDPDGWRTFVAARDQTILRMLTGRAAAVAADADIEEVGIGGARVYAVTPDGIAPDDRRVILDIHGGGLVMGAGPCCRASGRITAGQTGIRTWAVDYRMPPDHPYPTPLDDCVAAYRALLSDHRPGQIIVSGGSAGGNLAAALTLRARDEGLPLPAAVVLLTPQADLTESGDSFHTNQGIDPRLAQSLMPAHLLYAAGHDLTHPYLSPLFGDFSKGFPPTFLSTGTRDLFLSNTVRMHRALRAADIPAELHVLEAAPHGGFTGTTPEDHALTREAQRFIATHWDNEA